MNEWIWFNDASALKGYLASTLFHVKRDSSPVILREMWLNVKHPYSMWKVKNMLFLVKREMLILFSVNRCTPFIKPQYSGASPQWSQDAMYM